MIDDPKHREAIERLEQR
ncbi:Protein of unknown function [Bacillus wiedmannii]|uniref:Uncharacterized protein n=1 Tax=Bacillus wiedmannii TaxID=1890302 RepID=A0AB37Z1V4_9BACI|nr:Protein of unknown function [Bacillus wiedmannii]